MTDPRVEKLADLLVNYSVEVQPGEWVLLTGHTTAIPLIEATYERVVQAGGNVDLRLYTDTFSELFLKHANEDQLKWISPVRKLATEQADVSIHIRATENTRAGTNFDNNKQRVMQLAGRELMKASMARSAAGEHRWTLTNYPCAAFAQEADMSLRDFEDFVYSATFADREDPIAEWQKIHDMQAKYIDWLKGKKHVEVRGPNADLTLSIEDRTFINSDGKRNMPSGEIFTGPVEDSANGWVRFTYPAIRGGREVEGVELEFKDGKVVKASAKKNEEYLIAQLDSDEGARYLGEFAIGTNYGIKQFTKSILYDEKIGGSFHMAVGAGYPETGSKNESTVHWDFICDMRDNSEIIVDGELFYKNGEFQV